MANFLWPDARVTERTLSWIENLTIDHDDDSIIEIEEDLLSIPEDYAPATPIKNQLLEDNATASWPTVTSRSSGSIFDSHDATNRSESSTSIRYGRDSANDIRNITRRASVTNCKIDHEVVAKSDNDTTSTNQSTQVEQQTVFVTSCLQCTIAKLPCSRKLPACCRCIRNGCADKCLPQRRNIIEFSAPTIGAHHDGVVLIRRKEDEDDVLWAEKEGLAKDILEKWRVEQDQRNWAIPCSYGKEGGFKGSQWPKRVSHPGEGQGKIVCIQMEVRLAK